jgi:hypothetical protein
VTLNDLLPGLGSIIETYPDNTLVRPLDPRFSEINVTRRYRSEQVSHVDLVLLEPFPLDELEAAFGPYAVAVPDHPGHPNQAIFSIRQPSQPSDVALIATLDRAGATATVLTLRRDPH